MFGIDSPELLVIAIVALVVIGPKELPGLLRTWGRWMTQMRSMASEFRGHVDEMVRQSELDEVKKQIQANVGLDDLKALDPTREIKNAIQEGMAEGEKALAEVKSSFDNPLAEPESAPQVAVETAPQAAALETPPEVAQLDGTPEPQPATVQPAEAAHEPSAPEPPAPEPPAQGPRSSGAEEEQPAKAAAAG
jgi:sec-independent protein translocase protein TatB